MFALMTSAACRYRHRQLDRHGCEMVALRVHVEMVALRDRVRSQLHVLTPSACLEAACLEAACLDSISC